MTSAAGRLIGPYRLLEEIGSGGMGEVYRASRDDDAYRKQVAVKLIRIGQDSAHVVQRFHNERQILAAFDHPNIARLLDGGTTPEGLPYFVMELIEGEPIDRYCDRLRASVDERLRLFLEVCSAVQYAHRRLIVHRDLKPSNILVSADGVPKLLDFGIAKILDPGADATAAEHTRTVLRLMTPDYASPEQLRGQPITTASDVYSLGLLLYVLLTGLKPADAAGRTPLTLPENAKSWEPRRPSAAVRHRWPYVPGAGADADDAAARSLVREGSPAKLSRRLRGDLDNIVLMALRMDPARRYQSVEQLAEDLRRHQTSCPVLARADTAGYRLAKFIRRHRVGVAAGGGLAAALLAGLAVTMHEARIAELERARAERRFTDIVKLAHSLIFDINDSLQDLPGAAPARHLILRTGLQYLDSLSQEAAGDAALQREIAAAYEKLGDVQGRALEASEGDAAGAARSYLRALDLRRTILAASPPNVEVRRELVVNLGKLSDLMWNSGNPAEALNFSAQTLRNSEWLHAREPASPRYQTLLATSRLDYGFKLFKISGDSRRGLEYVRAALGSLEPAWAADASNVRLGRTLSLAYSRAAEILSQDPPALAQALSMDEKARAILDGLAAMAGANPDLAHLVAFTDHDMAAVLTAAGNLPAAEQHEQAALGAFRSLAAADPRVGEYHLDVSLALAGLAQIAARRGEPQLSLAQLEEALRESAAAASGGATGVNLGVAAALEERRLGEANAALAARAGLDPARRRAYWQAATDAYRKASAAFAALRGVSHEAAVDADEIPAELHDAEAALARAAPPGGARPP